MQKIDPQVRGALWSNLGTSNDGLVKRVVVEEENKPNTTLN